MIIRLDGEYNIIEAITVGGDPNDEGCCEVFDVPEAILRDIFSYKYIGGEFIRREDADAEYLVLAKQQKIKFLSEMCHHVIEDGIQIGDEHYSLTTTDQMNLSKLTTQAAMTPNLPLFYHADGGLCHQYTPEQIMQISTIGVAWITYHTTYFNFAKAYIESLTDFNAVAAFKYGSQIGDTALVEQMRTITDTTQVTFDIEIEDPFDYDEIRSPLEDIHEYPPVIPQEFLEIEDEGEEIINVEEESEGEPDN